MYRKFQLENAKGETWDLSDHLVKSFFSNPQGLGFTQTLETIQYGNALSVSKSNTSFPSVQGDLLFYDVSNMDKYAMYAKFVEFCTYAPLVLKYRKPVDNSVYHLDCEVTSMQKSEVKTDGILTCPIVFQGLGLWYGEEIEITGASPFTLVNDGHFPIGFEITLTGSMTNPYFMLEQDGVMYGEAKFDDTTAFTEVYVGSKDAEQSVTLKQTAILPNPLAYQDLSISNGSIYVTFIKLARGESTLTIGMDSGTINNAVIKYTPQYRSV